MNNQLLMNFKNSSWIKKIYFFLLLILMSFLLIYFISSVKVGFEQNYFSEILHDKLFYIFLILYIIIAYFIVLIFKNIKDVTLIRKILIIFFMALIPRLILTIVLPYVPTNDFANYVSLGKLFYNQDFVGLKNVIDIYQINEFAGLSILYSIPYAIFGESIRGYQIFFSCITSIIAIVTYLIGKEINEKSGLLAGVIFAIYPSNIVMAQVSTNQHLSILFAMLGIYFIINSVKMYSIKKSLILSCLCGLSFAISNFAHPSIIVTIIALMCFLITIIISCIKNKQKCKKNICIIFSIIFIFLGVKFIVNKTFEHNNVISKKTQILSPAYGKIAVGLNGNGQYDYDLYKLGENEPIEKRKQMFKDYIYKELSNRKTLLNTLIVKTKIMWGEKESSFIWYTDFYNLGCSINNILSPKLNAHQKQMLRVRESYRNLDYVFTIMIYICAAIGVIIYFNKYYNDEINLIVWVLLGWMSLHVLIEVQARYRYYAMPFIFIFAAITLMSLFNKNSNINYKDIIKNKFKSKE